MKVGFIGLGRMGRGIAANLVKAGHEVVVYNRSPARPRRWWNRVRGGIGGGGLRRRCGLHHAGERPGGGAGGARRRRHRRQPEEIGDSYFFQHDQRCFVGPACRRACAAGQVYVAAPVFGRPDAAAAAKLFIAAAGSKEALKTCAPLFEAIGQRTFVLSDNPASANLVKLSGNFLIASVIESLGEAMALVGKGGVDLHAYLDLLTSTLFSAPVYKTYGGLIADAKFEPAGFAAPLGQKDINLTLAAAETLQVPMPVASLLRDRFLTLMANGGENLDWSAIGKLAAKDFGQVRLRWRSKRSAN